MIEHGLEALKGGKPQRINFCRPKMCLMAAYEDTIRLLGNALITSTGPGERVNADIKAWSKRTNHQRHAHVEQACHRPVKARTSLRIPPAGCPRPLACLSGSSGLGVMLRARCAGG